MAIEDHGSEEYLEAIFKLAGREGKAKTKEVAAALGVSPASVTEEVKRLAARGLVSHAPYQGVGLTAEGLHRALHITRKHRLIERFLSDELHIGKDRVHEQACEMEHGLSDEADEALCRRMGGPDRCPHGRPIPPCDADVPSCVACLEKSAEAFAKVGKRARELTSVAALEPGRRAVIAFIQGGRAAVRRLCELGMTPGVEVVVGHHAPMNGPVEVTVRGCSLAVGREFAERIFVSPVG
jgi:DtxR family Mn-dependent transcriptional regulator